MSRCASQSIALFLLTVVSTVGCGSRGQKSGRPDIDAIPEIELRGAATKAALYLYEDGERYYELVTQYGFRGGLAEKADTDDPLIDRCGRGRTAFFINGLTADFTARDDPYQRAQIADERQKALAELDRVKQDIEKAKKAITDIEEDARKANVPAGWIR